MKKRLVALIIIVSLLCACGGTEQPTNTPAAAAPETTGAPPSPTAARTATPTVEPAPATIPPHTAVPAPGAGPIAFYSGRDGNPEIYVMNADGSDQRRLTFSPYEDSSPDWSPDGDRIAFISERDDPQAGQCAPDCITSSTRSTPMAATSIDW